ncbi:MAG: hypothetical protein WC729_23035 [Sphingomonas sp.]|jgi:hypothetical protein|uniref:hypothetical protein n=1 Tax=Sphingomonas sp. TaxID=28214 RepID=UPI003566A590
MQPTAKFCRTQEAQQRSRAAEAHLDNVRNIATGAANAWGKEAVLAERREARQAQAGLTTDTTTGPISWDRTLSENPDRGFAGQPRPAMPMVAG